jgi:threonine dehydrogenase-like Zn-dependent dehydrogenase
VDAVFDCVAHADTLDLAMHLLRPTGTLVLVGASGKQAVDWSLVWARRLTVAGTYNFGTEPALGGRETMDQVVEWLGDATYRVDGLVTHTFDLDDWTAGLATASAGPAAGCIKATLRPNPDVPLVGA